MLKRYQVLINDWLVDYLKKIADKYDLSFSEVVRAALCLQVIQKISELNPKCKAAEMTSTIKQLVMKKNQNKDVEPEELHKFLSKLYFETRKATECWEKTQKKHKK